MVRVMENTLSKVSEQEEFEEILDRMEEINEINIEFKERKESYP